MKLIIALFATCLAFAGVDAAACPAVNVVQNFDVAAYTGLWYEIARIPNLNQPAGSCVTAHYTLSNNSAEPVDVFNREFNDNTKEYQNITGTARPANNNGEGKLLVTFPVAPFPAPYWVVDTDYVNVALVHSCVSVANISSTSGWILGRTPFISTEDSQRVLDAMAANNIDGNKFFSTRQGVSCDYNGSRIH